MFAIGVMQLILATAMPFIVQEIGGSELYSWVFSSYMLASIAAIPLFSKLADIYGKRRFYILGMMVFALGSLYGALASTMPHLIGARVIQGFGAGIITPVSMAMVTDMFPPEKRGNMIGMFSFVQLLANLLSPPLGSFITKELGWTWIFLLNLGMVFFSVTLVALARGTQKSKLDLKLKEVDIFGGLLFGGFCLLAVLLSNKVSAQAGESSLSLLNSGSFLLLAAWILAGVLLFYNEKRQKNPIIKTEFFKVKILRRSLISAVLAGAIMYGLVTILPLCGVILNQLGYQLNESRVLLFFMVGITLGLLAGSRLSKLRLSQAPRYLWVALSLSSILLLYSIQAENIIGFSLFSIMTGLSTGGIMATFLINSQNAVQSEDRTVLSGLVQLGRYFGASVGITLLVGMLPEVGAISGIDQFLGTFVVLVALSITGLINELI
ncbi:arabinose efflux permease family protein [Desulfitobacterium dichloroeliminans LMG P-21439]|uniref:Arabinose efflux permease family protein n=2 Tax=Desulfitobacterium dichloroeliminans TaxID=233055 RepID=L0F627_DESDL|nr:arabinose efflux permease family protein [Desulfitobacterium dichloroeliminans LMG P-21439]